MRKLLVLLTLAGALGACGGAGSGGAAAPSTAPTAAPVVAGTDAPKPYGPAQTTDPNASPDYYGY
ncbi:MAG TPA: hypothetical protein VIN69_03935 [Candidatus Limnocylindria bacterium]